MKLIGKQLCLLVLTTCFAVLNMEATDVTIGNIVYSISDGNAVVMDGHKCIGDVVIPSSILVDGENCPVTGINHNAFDWCENITSIVMPNTVTVIGKSVFRGCASLNSVTLSNTLTGIEASAFSDCPTLSAIVIPESVTKIGSSAFMGCSSLKTIRIPREVTSISNNAFFGCASLLNFDVDIDNQRYVSVDGVLFSKDLSTLMCYPCANGDTYKIPNSVKNIGSFAFGGCSLLKDVIIPDGVEYIDYYAFFECKSLTTIIVPHSVKRIDALAFSDCTSLESISLSNNLEFVNPGSFVNCSSLKEFILDSDNPQYTAIDGIVFSKNKKMIVCFPPGRGGVYEIPDFVTEIGSSAFSGCGLIESVVIPNSVVSLGYSAFSSSSLTSVNIPSNIKYCDNGVFYGCSSLKEVTIPKIVADYGDEMFRDCISLQKVTIMSDVTSLGWNMFYGCTSLSQVYCQAKEPINVSTKMFYDTPQSVATLFVPKGCKDSYASAKGWKDFSNIEEMDFSVMGDINGDGVVNVSDVTALIDIVLNGGGDGFADINEDGVVNVSDVTALINVILAK